MESNTPSLKDLKIRYEAGKSMWEISQEMQCSVHKIAYWMTKYKIVRRSHSDATYMKRNPFGNPFLVKDDLSCEEQFLHGLGLGIYWGEGEKVSKSAIRVANTNPDLIKSFIRFLRIVCQIQTQKLSYSIVCFNDSNIIDVKMYWAKELGILPEKFGKIVQIAPQGKGSYKRKSLYGVCTVTFSNIKLKKWLVGELDKFSNAPMAQW